MKKVDKDSQIPLYYQLKNILSELIDNEELKANELVPTERELCEYHGISRMTVSKAIASLVNEGLLYRERGKGTFVVKNKEKHPLQNLLGFTEDMKQRGISMTTQIISFQRRIPTKKMQQDLHLGTQQEIFEIARLRNVDDEPYALEIAHIPTSLCEGLTAEMLENNSLYHILENKFNVQVDYGRQTLEPILVNDYESELLKVKQKTLALMFLRLTYSKQNIPIEVTRSIYRSDRYKFEIMLKR
ncbi:GntR family transcriptional regulator [Pelosinus sp. sgz500959]|uniref:GntR family transcriptional regulator n=1 Tax=Pelosinus sp. sgz500959 TaxID=3242472 RepID=UPI003671233D